MGLLEHLIAEDVDAFNAARGRHASPRPTSRTPI
jgi:hypothetical protein